MSLRNSYLASALVFCLAGCGDSTGEGKKIVSVVVSPEETSIYVGASTTFSATARDSEGDTISGVSFSWSTSDSAIATIDGSGRVTGVSLGSVTVTAEADGVRGTASLEVVEEQTYHSLTVTVVGFGRVTSSPEGIDCDPDCSGSFVEGTVVTLTATPTSGYYFDGWSGDCTGTGDCTVSMDGSRDVSAIFRTIQDEYTLSVTLEGSGTVVSSGGEIDCGPTCSADFIDGTAVTLTATPDAGHLFTGWSGDCTGSGECTVVMDAPRAVTANFEAEQVFHTLTVTVEGNGTVTSDPGGIECGLICSSNYLSGTVVELTATPNQGYVFTGWSGDCTGSDACSVTMDGSRAVTALFEPVYYQLTVTVEGTGSGRVVSSPAGIDCPGTCQAEFTAGTGIGLSTEDDEGSQFVDWTGDCAGAGSNCWLTMDTDKNAGAIFEIIQRTLVVNVNGGGRVTSAPPGIDCPGTCEADFDHGTLVEMTATPDPGWLFNAWGNYCSGSGDCSVLMDGSYLLSASFSGPFDFSIADLGQCYFAMINGESRVMTISLTHTDGAAMPVDLGASGLPAGVTAVFDPPTVTPDGTSTMTLTTDGSTELGQNTITVTGTYDSTAHSRNFVLEVHSPLHLAYPHGLALEAGGATALVTVDGSQCDRLVRVDTDTKEVIKTINSSMYWNETADLAIETGGGTVLVPHFNGFSRVDLTSGEVSHIAPGLSPSFGVALESGGATALVTDATRLVRVDLASGDVTPINSAAQPLSNPLSVAIEAGGTTALVAEYGADRLIRVNLGTGSILGINSGIYNPRGVAIEAGGEYALLTGAGWNNPFLHRVHLATGNVTPVLSFPCCSPDPIGVAIEAGGQSALFVDHTDPGHLVRVFFQRPVEDLAPSRQSAEVLYDPRGVAVEAGGTTALVTDCGAGNCMGSARLVRVDMVSGVVTPISTGLTDPQEVVIEAGGATALVVENDTGQVLRIDLSDGSAVQVAGGLNNPVGLALEAGGATALTAGMGWNAPFVARIDLASGAVSNIVSLPCCRPAFEQIAVEQEGVSAIAVDKGDPGLLYRIDLTNGNLSVVTSGLHDAIGVKVEAGGQTALVTEMGSYLNGRVVRVDLQTGARTVLAASLRDPRGIAIDPSGDAIAVTYDRLIRVDTDSADRPVSSADGLWTSSGFVIEPAGDSILFFDCGPSHLAQWNVIAPPDCSLEARLRRVDLVTLQVTDLVTGLNRPGSMALEAGGTSVIASDCGPAGTGNCTTLGRLVRINLAGGLTQIASGLDNPRGVYLLPGGTAALVAEAGTGRLLRVELSDGSYSILAAGLQNPADAFLEASGDTVLVSDDQGIKRVDMTSGSVTPVVRWRGPRFVIEAGGATAVASEAGEGLNGSLMRVNLTTGGVDILAPGLFDNAHTLVLDSAGNTLYLMQNRDGLGILLGHTLP